MAAGGAVWAWRGRLVVIGVDAGWWRCVGLVWALGQTLKTAGEEKDKRLVITNIS